jgi:dipeptidyl aminopeptidase/acylaminoacyl peptidase
MSIRRLSIAVVVLLLAGAAVGGAQTKRRLTFVDLLNVPQLRDPQLSPDGREVLYTLAEADWQADRRIRHIWRVDAGGTNPLQLTRGARGEDEPRWSPDGRTIAFVATRGEAAGDPQAQIFLISADGGEARALTHHATSVSRISWAPDGRSIYFIAPEAKTDAEKARATLKDDVFAFDENYQQDHLWMVSVAEGQERQITAGNDSVLEYAVSRDGSHLVMERAPDPLYGDADQGEVWVMRADGSDPVRLTRNTVPEGNVELSPDNSQVLFIAQANQQFDFYYNGRIFLEPASGGPVRVLTADLPYEIDAATWSKDGQSVIFVANMGVHSEIFRQDLAGGAPKQLTDGAHAIGGLSYRPALDRLLFTVSEAENPGDVWAMADAGGAPARVTHVFDYLSRDFDLAREEKVSWKGADGTTVEGLLFYPVGYRAGQRYPLVVETHGGPQASDKFGFGSTTYYPQGLAAQGYVVFQPNYRGSTGYGDAFLRDMVGHYFQNAHLDVMAGVDALIARGLVDPSEMVASGWSAGGHMTDKLITFTDRFKAAASGAGAADWQSMYAQSDVRFYRTPWFGGTPWQKDAPIAAYWDNSPLKFVSNVKTPTIFFVGQMDPRVPMPQSVEMYRGVRSQGVPTHLYVAPREPHGWQELRHELFKMNAEFAWFEKYARGRTFAWEQAPAGAR